MVRNKTLQLDKRTRTKSRMGGRSRVRIRRVMLAVIMTAVMAVPAAALAMEVDIPYQQTFTNDSAEASVANSFDYELTPADASTPMPADSTGGVYGFSLLGNTSGSLNLNITYPKPGYYYYTVKSKVDSPQQGYTYSSTTYTVMVMIVNGSEDLQIGAITIQDANKNKYDRLVFDTRYYKARPGGGGGGDNGGGAGGGGAGGGAAGVAPPAGAPGGGTGNPPTTINDPKPPLAGTKHGEDYWALINLICMLLTWLTAIVAGILYIKRRREAPDEEEAIAEAEEYEDPQKLKRKGLLRILTVLVAIISLIVFILTEDMTLPMELVDEYTIWMIIFLAAALLLALISRKTTEEYEEYEATPEG